MELEVSTESVLENLQEIQNTDPGIIKQYLENLAPQALNFCLQVLIACLIYFVGTRIIKLVRKIVRKTLEKRDADEGVKQFLDSLVKAACYILLVLIILTMFGVTTASVVAVLGSAGLAIGLALQGSLANFAGGVLILLLKPFKVGDYIIEDAHKNEGTVKEISIFYTKLVTVDNKVVVIPNGTLSDSSITNVTDMDKRKLIITVGISYDADIRQAKEILSGLVEKEEDCLKDEPADIYVSELGASSVDLGVRFWVKTEKYWEVKWRLTENIKYAFDQNGIEIPYQKIDVNIKK